MTTWLLLCRTFSCFCCVILGSYQWDFKMEWLSKLDNQENLLFHSFYWRCEKNPVQLIKNNFYWNFWDEKFPSFPLIDGISLARQNSKQAFEFYAITRLIHQMAQAYHQGETRSPNPRRIIYTPPPENENGMN